MHIQRLIQWVVLGMALVLVSIPALQAKEPVIVFAAASLKNALDDITALWQTASGGTAVASYAGSAALAQQIYQGAPASVFISANTEWMDYLEQHHLVRAGTRRDLLGNTLVLIAHGKDAAPVSIGPGFDLLAHLNGGRLAMAMVDSVPAGIYGKAALTALGVWASVEPHVAQVDNVRAALLLVLRDEAPLGIVYATDAAVDDDVTVVGVFPANSHPAIVYPAAITAETRHPQAQAFLDYLSSDAARQLFEKYGFAVLK